jgi:hypothetical protein
MSVLPTITIGTIVPENDRKIHTVVKVPYTGFDDDNQLVTLSIAQYKLPGASFLDATARTLHPDHDGSTGLLFNTSGIAYDFIWDVEADVQAGKYQDVVFQLQATDGASISATQLSTFNLAFNIPDQDLENKKTTQATRMDFIQQRTIPSDFSTTLPTGKWIVQDSDGKAIRPTALGDKPAFFTLVGTDRPDTAGSGTIAVAQGKAIILELNSSEFEGAVSEDNYLCVNTTGCLTACSTPSLAVAIAENTRDDDENGLLIRTL